MKYIENPKTKNSGIMCVIPQKGTCPQNCSDCFFQAGRSYLEPLNENLPNMPESLDWYVYRINDGNDSNNQRELVIDSTQQYKKKFFNTSIPHKLYEFASPVVLTINPSKMTDESFHEVEYSKNLMFVRFRLNTWNTDLFLDAVRYYSEIEIPVVATFMAYYFSEFLGGHEEYYEFKKRTLNSYWVIKDNHFERLMDPHRSNPYVFSCGKTANIHACRFCGNCLREYYATTHR
jgi:hypothetical protein